MGRLRPAEIAFFKSLGQYPYSTPVPIEDLETVSIAVGENEDGSVHGVEIQLSFGDLPLTVEAFTHVTGLDTNPNL